MKYLYVALLALIISAKPTDAHAPTLYQLILSKCKLEFSDKVAEEKAKFYTPLIQKYAKKYGLPAHIVASVVWHESNYKPRSRSPYNALGLMQVVPYPGRFPAGSNPYDPAVNLDTGCRMLRYYLYRFNGDWHRALTAYNFGERPVSRGLSRSRYSRAVLKSAGVNGQSPRSCLSRPTLKGSAASKVQSSANHLCR